MNFKFNLFAISLVLMGLFFLSGNGSAAVLNTCTDINVDYFGTPHTLGSNITGAEWDGSCFTLGVAADNNSFELDCNGFALEPDLGATNLFDTNGFAIDRVTFRNCSFNSGNPVQLNSIFYVDADVNTAELLDTVGTVNMDDFTIADINVVTDTTLDFNFNGTDFNLYGDAQNSPLGFYLSNADISTINIYDFNVAYDSNWLDFDNLGFSIFDEAALFKFDDNSDVNNLNLLNGIINITQGNLFDFKDATEGTLDINFSNSSVTINDSNSYGFHLDMSTYSTLTIHNLSLIAIDLDSLFYVEGPGVDLNTLSFKDSILTMTADNAFFGFVGVPDTFLSFDFNDTNVDFVNFEGFGLNLNAMGTTSFLNINTGSDINTIVFDGTSNINQSSGTFVSILNGDPNGLNFEFGNATFELGLINSIFDINTVAGTISDLSINEFYLNSADKNIFTVTDTTISSFNIIDSNLNTSANGLISLDATSSVAAGLITNNIFRYNIEESFVFTNAIGTFLADFNEPVNSNQNKRNVFGLSSDSSPLVGGNLWLNPVSGDNWCVLDSLMPKGICDGNFNILGTDNNYVDLAAIIRYKLPDLNVTTIDSNNYIRYNEDANLTTTIFNNRTDSTADLTYYVTFDINNDGSIDENTTVETDLNFAQSVQTSYTWDANISGNIDVNVCVSYLDGINSTDNDASNDCNLTTFHVYAVDFNANAITFSDSTLVYPEVQDINFTYSNLGDANAESDYNIIYYINDDENANYNFTEDLNFSDSDSNIYSWTPESYYADANIYVCIVYNDTDENDSSNNCVQRDLNVFYRDVNVTDIVPTTTTPVYGDTIDFNVLIGNQGDYDSNLVDINLYVIKGATTYTWVLNDQNISDGTIQTLDLGSWDVNLTGNIDLNVVVTPSEADYNNNNHTRLESTGLVVTYVDLNAFDIDVNDTSIVYGDVVDINVDYRNSGDANADANYYVLYYINSVLDANYIITEDLNASATDTNNYVWTSDLAGDDVNVYVCLDYTETDYNSNNDCTQQTLTVLSVDLNGTSLSLDDSSVTTGATVVATFTYGNQGDANATATYDTTVYLSGASQCTAENTTDLVIDGADTYSCSFTAPSTAGTYTISGIADYSGYDDNADNNSASATLTVTAVPSTPPSGGGGTSGTKKETEESTEYEFNASNGESPLYIDTVEVNYEVGKKESANLKVLLPNMASTDKISDNSVTVIKYLELKYSGDQSKIVNAIVNFTVGKDEASDPSLIKLARLKDGVWEYYTPSKFVDNGTFYTFEVEVPGFSYFAVVLKASALGEITPVKEPAKETVEGTEPATTAPSTTEPTTQNPEPETSGLTWWIWLIIAIVVVVIVVVIIMDLRK